MSKGLSCKGPQSLFQITVLQQAKAVPYSEDQPASGCVTNETTLLKGNVPEAAEIAQSSNCAESRTILDQGPDETWTGVAFQSFLPYILNQSKACGLLLPWQLVRKRQSDGVSLAYDAVVRATTLQAFGREVPQTIRSSVVTEGVCQYGKALSLVNALLEQAGTAITNTAIVCVMGLTSYGFHAGVQPHDHLRGLRELFRMRGTSMLDDDSSRSILKAFRDRAVVSAICQHGALPFNPDEHSWFFVTLGQSDFDNLQMIALTMPVLIRRHLQSSFELLFDHESLIRDTYAIIDLFLAWHQGLPRNIRASSETQDSSGSRMLRWYRLCHIICLRILEYSLAALSGMDRDRNTQERRDVERGLVLLQISESFKALGIDVLQAPGHNDNCEQDGWVGALAALAPFSSL